MKLVLRSIMLAAAVAALSAAANAQTPARPQPGKAATAAPSDAAIRGSAAFAELQLRRAELESEVEALVLEYTDEFPKVIALRSELDLIKTDIGLLLAMPAADAPKLTVALGRLLVRRAELNAALAQLLKTYKEGHPDVKRAKRRVEIYDGAVREILGK